MVVTIVRESTDSSNGGQDVKSTDQYTRDEEGRLQSWSHGWYYDEYGADDIYSVNVCLDEVPDGGSTTVYVKSGNIPDSSEEQP